MPSRVPPLPHEQLYAAIRIPPAEQQFGAMVEHLTISKDQGLVSALVDQLAIPQDVVQELMRFGAVYYCNVVPMPSGKYGSTLPPDELESISRAHKLGIAMWGKNPHHHQPRRVLTDQEVTAGGYVRVHLQPKRFPAAYKVDWSMRVLHNGPDYVVVNKPAGVQVPPTADNILESVVAKVAEVLGAERDTLLTTHRLDAGTEGVLVIAKTPAFARYFQELLRDKQDSVRKLYRCLASGRPPLGRVMHWASIRQRSKGEPPHTVMHDELPEGAAEGGALRRCELIVQQVEEVQLTGDARQQWGERAWEVTVELITGRTHQIRAQLAALGCPLLGDALYSALLRAKQLDAQRQAALAFPAEPVAAEDSSGACQVGCDSASTGAAGDSTGRGAARQLAASSRPGGHDSLPAGGDAGQLPGHMAERKNGDTVGGPGCPSSSANSGCSSGDRGLHAAAAASAAVGPATTAMEGGSDPGAAGVRGVAASSCRRDAAEGEAGEPRPRAGVATAAAGEWQWQDELRQDPLRPIALQAFRLEVLEAGLMGDTPPAVFEAGIPWWRASA